MKTLLRLLLKNRHHQNRSPQAQKEQGMTLIELLIGMVMAFLILTPMLAFVVDMLNTDRREQVKANTEQDIQAAVDFIAQDLSQAIYIYDNNAINVGTATTPAIRPQLPENGNLNRIPILVFWKRKQLPKSLPIDTSVSSPVKPKDCEINPDQCNDTYVLSLVAYYQFKDKENTWCQPSGNDCPTRIVRYEISDGIKNPSTQTYYKNDDSETKEGQRQDPAFNPLFVLSDPKKNVTLATGLGSANFSVLVNYIDHTDQGVPTPPNCKTTLGVQDPPAPAPALTQTDLLVADNSTNSFYACVDSARNIARVTIRGNSLRRLQADNANYKTERSAFFPTASVQVQGLGAVGK
jgi:type II secretory pathway pseudopilin PulG